jgi:hypothetical protein
MKSSPGWKATQATRYEPRPYPFMNLGRIYLRQGRWWEVLREFEGAVRSALDDRTARKGRVTSSALASKGPGPVRVTARPCLGRTAGGEGRPSSDKARKNFVAPAGATVAWPCGREPGRFRLVWRQRRRSR